LEILGLINRLLLEDSYGCEILRFVKPLDKVFTMCYNVVIVPDTIFYRRMNMELFDKKFVYFEWDNILEGKEVFLANALAVLKRAVMLDEDRLSVEENDGDYPFTSPAGVHYSMAYYDPNYSCKRAYMEGKVIQCKSSLIPDDKWDDCVCSPEWADHCEYRVKPEEELKETYMVAFNKRARCMVYGPDENDSGNYHVLFKGTDDECSEYMREKVRFNLIMAAYYCDGKQIQYRNKDSSDQWKDCSEEPYWAEDCEYRVKPEEEEEKKWRPFKDKAFLAGLKAGSQLDRVWHDYDAGEDCYEDSHEGRWIKREDGRPKWHDMRKTPEDLPETLHPVYAKLDSGTYVFAYCVNEIWHGNGECKVIAWCEIPRFEDGE
jgi:hypothetical protein